MKRMFSKKLLLLRANRIIYGLLVLWVGGVSPLIHFAGFSPHQEVRAYRVAFLVKPDRASELSRLLPEIFGQGGPAGRLAAYVRLIGPTPPGEAAGAHFLSALRTGHLPAVEMTTSKQPALTDRVPPLTLSEQSAWLAPPENPPRLLLGLSSS